MKTILCVLLLAIATQATSTFFPETPSPVLFWSGSNIFSGKSHEYLEKTTSNQIANFIHQLETKSSNPSLPITSNVNPEIIVVFVAENKGFSSVQLSEFASLVQGSESSVIIPYNYQSQYSATSRSVLRSLTGSYIVSRSGDNSKSYDPKVNRMSTSSLSTFLESAQEKSLDRKTNPEVIVVYLKGESIKYAQGICQQVSQLTNGNYIAVAFADEKNQDIEETKDAVHFQVAVTKRQAVPDNSDDYFPTAVWEGIMVSVLLLILVVIGVSCTASVQTPKRWGTGKYVCQFTEISDP